MKILVVDDEENIRGALSRSLLAEGYECKTVKNAYDAIRIFSKFKPEIVITGFRMSGMGGIELMKFIQNQNSKIPVILLSCHGELEIAIDAAALDAYAILHKPLDLDEILITLGQISKEINEEIGKLLRRGKWINEYARLKKASHPQFSQQERLTGANYDRFNR